MILKTYARIFTNDLDLTLRTLQPLHKNKPHLRFDFAPWQLAAIGDILVVAGTDDSLAPIRGSYGPWIVGDLQEARELLLRSGATIVKDIVDVPTGTMLYARHPDGTVVEYVQWNPELVEKFITKPLSEGQLSSQI